MKKSLLKKLKKSMSARGIAKVKSTGENEHGMLRNGEE